MNGIGVADEICSMPRLAEEPLEAMFRRWPTFSGLIASGLSASSRSHPDGSKELVNATQPIINLAKVPRTRYHGNRAGAADRRGLHDPPEKQSQTQKLSIRAALLFLTSTGSLVTAFQES